MNNAVTAIKVLHGQSVEYAACKHSHTFDGTASEREPYRKKIWTALSSDMDTVCSFTETINNALFYL